MGRKYFKDNGTTCMHTQNKDMLACDNRKITVVGNPIVLVESETSHIASSMGDENFSSFDLKYIFVHWCKCSID